VFVVLEALHALGDEAAWGLLVPELMRRRKCVWVHASDLVTRAADTGVITRVRPFAYCGGPRAVSALTRARDDPGSRVHAR
jgi:hypothetical protein